MESSSSRQPVVAGTFYPAHPDELRGMIGSFIDDTVAQVSAYGCVVPHAGYVYSGRVAGRTLSGLVLKKRIILFGPNHTGIGVPISIYDSGEWITPLGSVRIDTELAQIITQAGSPMQSDTAAHQDEHSLEVIVPFLQYLDADVRILPITFKTTDLDLLRETGNGIAEALRREQIADQVLLIASSDMTHYESEHEARRKDTTALHAMRTLDEEKLFETVRRLNISMCGYAPVAAMMVCAKALGATAGRLVTYQTSGEVTGDHTSVVGYAGVIVE